MHLNVRIEKLVIPELTAGDRRRLVSALEQELLRLLREQGSPDKLVALSTLHLRDAGLVAVSPDARPDAIGRQVAAKIYRELWKEEP